MRATSRRTCVAHSSCRFASHCHAVSCTHSRLLLQTHLQLPPRHSPPPPPPPPTPAPAPPPPATPPRRRSPTSRPPRQQTALPGACRLWRSSCLRGGGGGVGGVGGGLERLAVRGEDRVIKGATAATAPAVAPAVAAKTTRCMCGIACIGGNPTTCSCPTLVAAALRGLALAGVEVDDEPGGLGQLRCNRHRQVRRCGDCIELIQQTHYDWH